MNSTDDEKLLSALFDNTEDNTDYQGIEVPAGLQQRLHAIAESKPSIAKINNKAIPTHLSWRAFSGIAASTVIAVCLFVFAQQNTSKQASLNEAELARQDLALAFNYINKSVNRAHQKAQPHIMQSISKNLNKAVIAPVFNHKNTARI